MALEKFSELKTAQEWLCPRNMAESTQAVAQKIAAWTSTASSSFLSRTAAQKVVLKEKMTSLTESCHPFSNGVTCCGCQRTNESPRLLATRCSGNWMSKELCQLLCMVCHHPKTCWTEEAQSCPARFDGTDGECPQCSSPKLLKTLLEEKCDCFLLCKHCQCLEFPMEEEDNKSLLAQMDAQGATIREPDCHLAGCSLPAHSFASSCLHCGA